MVRYPMGKVLYITGVIGYANRAQAKRSICKSEPMHLGKAGKLPSIRISKTPDINPAHLCQETTEGGVHPLCSSWGRGVPI